MNNREPMRIWTGQPFTRQLQCKLFGPDGTPAVYNATDVLTCEIIQSRQTVAMFSPTITFFTKLNTQTGYGQGQVQISGTATQAALLMATNSYTIDVWRTIAGNTANPELIAQYPIVVESLTI